MWIADSGRAGPNRVHRSTPQELPMNTSRSPQQWRDFIDGCLDFRPEDEVYRVRRSMFTEPELFDLEMELIFEKTWIYACHESEIRQPNDFITDRKSTRLNSSHQIISYAVFCL